MCIGQGLKRVTHFFRDGHLDVWQAAAPTEPVAGPSPGPTSIPADDPDRPSLRFVDDSTALLRLPDFTETYKPLIDSLIATNLVALTAKPFLIVDLRGNGGGYTGSYRRVSGRDELREALDAGFSSSAPQLVEVPVAPGMALF